MKPRTLLHLAPLVASVASSLVVACGASPETPPATPPVAPSPPPAPPPASPPMATEAPPKVRLPSDTRPTAETIELHIDPTKDRFSGAVDIAITLDQPRSTVWLHGKGLNVTRATASPDGGQDVSGTWKQEDASGFASVRFAQPLPAGKARLHVEYDAPWGPKLEGLYKLTQGGASYAFTQFESIAARYAFPCFDEPGFKIPFDTTLVVPADQRAISNTREIDRRAEGSDVRVHFAPTLPLPSYLVAFAVGPLDVVAAPDIPPNAVRKRPLPLRGVTTRGHGKEIAYALAHTGDFVALEEQLFGIEYPFDKLDILAVGDKGGAMENAGAITFADSLLLFDDKTAAFSQKAGYASVMAHELAHQWTGDLVTAAWWDDIWLNEAFATWVAAKIVDQWDPKMQAGLQQLDRVEGAIRGDGLVSARAVRQPIASTDDIENAFDGITYDKGGGVLAMFERWVGADTFKRGLHDYLQAHRFANATADDFLTAESAAAGKDVKTPFLTFLDQPGVPFVQAEVKCDGAPTLHLKQSRYLPLGSTGDANEIWQIPVCARDAVGKDASESCTLLTDREGDLPLGPKCPDWVMPNSDAAGYFRFALAPADLAKLQTKGFARLTPRERVAYADGLRGGYSRGTLSAKEVFPAAAVLATDSHPDIAAAPLAFIRDADEWLYGDALRRKVEGYTRTLYAPAYHALGWASAKDEDPDRTQLRVRVLSALAFTARDPAVRAEAKKRGLAFLGYGKDGKIHPEAVDPNLAAAALVVVGEEADAALWDSVKATLATVEDMTLRRKLVRLLIASRKPELASRIRDLVFDPVLRPTETSSPLWSALSAPETREETWTWLKQNYDKVLAALPQHHGRTQVIAMASSFCDEGHAKDVEAVFTPARIAGIDGAPRVLASTLEEIRLCAARRSQQEPGVREFFKKR